MMGKSRCRPRHVATALTMFALGGVSATTVHASPPKGRYHVVAGLANEDRTGDVTGALRSRAEISRAVIWARASRGLRLARQAYIRSSFGWCQRRLLKVEKESRGALHTIKDFELMKRLNQWLGLCTAVRGDKREATVVFARAGRLPGPSPDPQVFPPAIMYLYAKAVQNTGAARCGPVQASGLRLRLLDGRSFQTEGATTIGQHYGAWEGGSGLITINGACRLMAKKDAPLSEQDALVTSRELEDDAFTGALAVRTQSTKIAFRHIGTGRRFIYSLTDGQLSEFPSATRTPGLRATSTSSRALNERGRELTSPIPARVHSADSAVPRWYERWWVWALVGGVVVTSVVVPVALTGSDDPSEPTFTLTF